MNLTKENVKKICGIILFTVVVLVIVQNYEKVGNAIGLLWGIIFPFVLGGIIAFILNIPMRAIEKLLFKSKNGKQKKYARPLSMIITFLLVIGVIAGVILIVVPQIGGTVRELTKSAEAFFPKVQKWAEDMFSNNTQIHDWIASLQFNTDKLMDTAINFLQNGAGNVKRYIYGGKSCCIWNNGIFYRLDICVLSACEKRNTSKTSQYVYAGGFA